MRQLPLEPPSMLPTSSRSSSTTSRPRRARARAAARPTSPPPTTTASYRACTAAARPVPSPAAGPPLGHVRALHAERGVLAVARVHPGAVGQLGEDSVLQVADELAEPRRVVLGVA